MRINEDILAKERKICLLCGEEGLILYKDLKDRLFKAPGIWQLMECSKCELVWINPCPIDIGKLYDEYYTHQIDNFSSKQSWRENIKMEILKRELGYPVNVKSGLLIKILSLIGPVKEFGCGSVMFLGENEKGRILDIGCGNGSFLAKMRALGWECYGVEPDPNSARIAKEFYGLEVFQGTLEQAKFSNGYFDAITMNHVIEHVSDPIKTLIECWRILKTGGKLVVITPNIKSLGRLVFGKQWVHWDPPRHLFLFSPKSLCISIKQAGFKVQNLWTISRDAMWVWRTSKIIEKGKNHVKNSQKRLSSWVILEGIIFWAVEYSLCKLRYFGEEIVLKAVK
jgi:2-polyprenyl-3-methyl-5-hydroxy-6-metoxy-1,4-benzoquinol methylase